MIEPSVIDNLCAAAVQYGASDLLLHEGKRPKLRVSGGLAVLDCPVIEGSDLIEFAKKCGAPDGALDHDSSYVLADGTRFRVNLLHQLGRRAAVLRRISSEIPEMAVLGLPDVLLQDWIVRKSGIILVAGPTGSGKSTTLASALEWLNQRYPRHVVTIEDPIEYVFTDKESLFSQREVGIDTASFAEGLRRSLRQNPDIIFLGEIRDALSAMTAIQASETGHLVLATVHSATCAETVSRIELLFPMNEREAIRKTLSQQLLGILCQRLLPGAQSGAALAVEYFANIGATREMIQEGRLSDLGDFIMKGDPKTNCSFLNSLARLVREGKITEQVAMESTDNPQELSRTLRGISSAASATRR